MGRSCFLVCAARPVSTLWNARGSLLPALRRAHFLLFFGVLSLLVTASFPMFGAVFFLLRAKKPVFRREDSAQALVPVDEEDFFFALHVRRLLPSPPGASSTWTHKIPVGRRVLTMALVNRSDFTEEGSLSEVPPIGGSPPPPVRGEGAPPSRRHVTWVAIFAKGLRYCPSRVSAAFLVFFFGAVYCRRLTQMAARSHGEAEKPAPFAFEDLF